MLTWVVEEMGEPSKDLFFIELLDFSSGLARYLLDTCSSSPRSSRRPSTLQWDLLLASKKRL